MTEEACRFVDRAFLAELRARTRLADVVAGRVALKRQGRELVGLCPFHAEKTPSFTVVEGKGFYHCFGCGAHGDAIRFLMEDGGLDFAEAVEELAVRAGLAPDREGRVRPKVAKVPRPTKEDEAAEAAASIDWARNLWRNARPAPGTLVVPYLRARGIMVERLPHGLPPTLRFAASLAYRSEKGRSLPMPAMVAAMQDSDGAVVGIHRTYLGRDADGRVVKADVTRAKKMGGKCWGAAIRLAPAGPTLAIAEGIETALSVMCATGMPCWAAGSLGNIAGAGLGRGAPHPERAGRALPSRLFDPLRPGLLPPADVREIVICEDADNADPHTADCLYARAERRFLARGLKVRRARPPAGMDFNDLLRASA